jgi:hypothetical protein
VTAKWEKREIEIFKKEFNISSLILIDETGSAAAAYKVSGYPETFLSIGKERSREKVSFEMVLLPNSN